jgi:hypothetical protein
MAIKKRVAKYRHSQFHSIVLTFLLEYNLNRFQIDQ